MGHSAGHANQEYSRVAKWLHWIIALLFLGAYCSVYFRHWFTEPKTDLNWNALQLHLSFGITIGVFVLLRVIWRLSHKPPPPVQGPKWQMAAARWTHLLLYVVMIGMPITGFIGTGVGADYFFLFELPKFADTFMYQWLVVDVFGSSFAAIEPTVDFIHKDVGGELLVWILIAIHMTAGLYHHFILRDDTLKRII